jgi:RNA 2',3'-cyclic 3'-phosphodiesterase
MHDRARLFTAVWPDPRARERLAAESAAWRWPPAARPVDAAKLHLTLHFIGAFPRSGVDELAAALAAVAPSPTTLAATRREIWRGGIAVVLFAADAALFALHAAIGGAVAGFGVALDPRPFAPHVTLARGARGAAPPPVPPELEWRADGFALVESAAGDYRVLRAFGAAGALR